MRSVPPPAPGDNREFWRGIFAIIAAYFVVVAIVVWLVWPR